MGRWGGGMRRPGVARGNGGCAWLGLGAGEDDHGAGDWRGLKTARRLLVYLCCVTIGDGNAKTA